MARQEEVTVTYETLLCDGLRESNMQGVVYGEGPDEPFRVKLVKKTSTMVRDGRGVNWQDSHSVREDVVEMTMEQAEDLARSLITDIGYAARVAERRVLVPMTEEVP